MNNKDESSGGVNRPKWQMTHSINARLLPTGLESVFSHSTGWLDVWLFVVIVMGVWLVALLTVCYLKISLLVVGEVREEC